MNYEEYYDNLIKTLNNSIDAENEIIRNKIFNFLLLWYKKNYEEKIKRCFDNKDENQIVNMTKEIQNICSLSDYRKFQEIYECPQLTEISKLSNKIFNLIKDCKQRKVSFGINDYNYFINELNKYEQTFPKIIKNRFNEIKSECMLDLQYLLKKGNVDSYSFRTYNYLQQFL